MSEVNCNTNLRQGIFRIGDRWDRIENAVGAGLLDINCCLRDRLNCGHEMWIETKNPDEPKRASTPLFGSNHRLSQEQRNWIFRQTKAGGRAFLYIETQQRRIMLRGNCCEAKDFDSWTLQQYIDEAIWYAKKPMDLRRWDDLRGAMLCY